MPILLNDFRHFILETGLISEQIQDFHNKWLTNLMIQSGIPVVNLFSSNEIDELKHELSKIQL
jgi:hypothetical protein